VPVNQSIGGGIYGVWLVVYMAQVGVHGTR
jgi:hypothetical protein